MADYFDEHPVYDDDHFRGTFQLPKRLFLEIVQRIEASGRPFFQEGYDGGVKKVSRHFKNACRHCNNSPTVTQPLK
jgi:hypothetical protein